MKLHVEFTSEVNKLKHFKTYKSDEDFDNKEPFRLESLLHDFDNGCREHDCEQYYNLALLYRSKNKIRKALQVLRKMGNGDWSTKLVNMKLKTL